MSYLTDAELALGLSRHLSVYQMGPERAALEQLEFAGWTFDVAFRLQGSTVSSASRVQAIGLDVGLGVRRLRDVIVTMESMGWITTARDTNGQLVSITESIPAAGDLIQAAPTLFDVLMVGPVERAALALLRATTLQPLLEQDAIQIAATAERVTGHDQAAADALRYLTHTGLIRRVVVDDGRPCSTTRMCGPRVATPLRRRR